MCLTKYVNLEEESMGGTLDGPIGRQSSDILFVFLQLLFSIGLLCPRNALVSREVLLL